VNAVLWVGQGLLAVASLRAQLEAYRAAEQANTPSQV